MKDSSGRKRRLDVSGDGGGGHGDERAATAQEIKRRQIQQQSWGFREVLAECGLRALAPSSGEGAPRGGLLPLVRDGGRGIEMCIVY